MKLLHRHESDKKYGKFGSVWLLFVLVLIGLIGQHWAVSPAQASSAPSPVNKQLVETKIKEVEARGDMDEETKATLTELYRKTLSELETSESYDADAAAFDVQRQSAPVETAKIRSQLEKKLVTPNRESMKVSAQTPIAELEQLLASEEADLTAVEAKLSDIEALLQKEANRPNEARARLNELKQKQQKVEADTKLPQPAGELPALTEARRWLSAAQRSTLSAEIHMLDKELLSQMMRMELLRAQRERTARSVQHMRARVSVLEELLNEVRVSEAQAARVKAASDKQAAAGKHPLIRQLAEQNAELTEELASAAADLDAVQKRTEEVSLRAKLIEDGLRSAQERLEIAGMSRALGSFLAAERRQLPDARALQRKVMVREDAIGEAELRQVRYRDEQRRLSDIDGAVDQMVAALPPDEQDAMRGELTELAKSRSELLDKALVANSAYVRALTELDFAQQRLGEAVEAYDDWLAEHLMWIRSDPTMGLDSVANMGRELRAFFSAKNWANTEKSLWYAVTHAPYLSLIVLVGVGLLAGRRRLRRLLLQTGHDVGDPDKDNIQLTFRAAAITGILAATWPLLTYSVGWGLVIADMSQDFAKGVGYALIRMTPVLFIMFGIRGLCIPGGLADRHFGWDPTQLHALRRHIRWLTPAVVSLIFVTIVISQRISETDSVDLSRLTFILLMITLAVFLAYILGPKGHVLAGYIRRHPGGLLARLRYVWYPIMVGAPLLLGVLAFLGYFYAGGLLARSLVDTLGLLLGLVVVREILRRWLLLTRRRLRRLEAQRKAAAETEAGVEHEEGTPELAPEAGPDLDALDAQTRKLLNTIIVLAAIVGISAIWADIVPALRILDQVSLWQQTAVVDGTERLIPVTLADLLLALFIIILTMIAARNLPAVIEIVLLRATPLDQGSRYATSTLIQYVIVGAGVVLLFATLGGSWSQIQWLVAALGVGIGFGLQEIVANFISGIIILFERPIRVGDVVTVGDTSGVVSRIRIRATTIRNWDQQELLVPNKEFITTRLLNWSLSDTLIRTVVSVGVAYGTDVSKAMQFMAQAAKEHELVLDEPEPILTFEDFGDNSLLLKLRFYMGTVDNRLKAMSEIREAINRKFNEAGIVVAFPQRDVHINTTQPLEVKIRRDSSPPDAK
jgi:potassium efflux system protein